VRAGAGGASDQGAMMQAASKEQPDETADGGSVEGRASGAEALIYMKTGRRRPHKVLIAYLAHLHAAAVGQDPVQLGASSPRFPSSRSTSSCCGTTPRLPDKNVKEVSPPPRGANPPFKMGGTGSKREVHVLTVFLEKKTGAKFAYLPYKSGGEAATQLVGNHTQSNVNNPSRTSRCGARGRCGRCAYSTRSASSTRPRSRQAVVERHPDLQGAGVDVQYLMLRAMFLPGKVTAEQTAFYVDLFRSSRRRRNTRTTWRSRR
jgi:tripartite-type tricarboxylate transporter receptor subunit TctC